MNGRLRRRLPGGALAALLLAAPATAAPRNIDDCEAIKEADAYNRCLASFGPTRGQHGATYPKASEGEKGSRGPATRRAEGGARPSPRPGVTLGHGGRVRMEFTPGKR
jgi:hypothetical protein